MLKRMAQSFQRRQTFFGVIGLLFLFFFAFSYAMFQGGFVSWFVFYCFLPVFIQALLVLFYPLRDLKISRVIKKRELFGGETLHVTVELNRKLPFPLFYLVIDDQLPSQIRSRNNERSKALFSLGFKRHVTFSYDLKEMLRGEYRLKDVEIKTGDIFGFVKKKRVVTLEDTVIVYPKIQPVDSWMPKDLAFGGSHRSKKHFEKDLTSLSSIRDYMPGDRLSWLDWKATARTNHLVTKQFEHPLNRDMIIVLDCFGEATEEHRPSFERSISLAASLLERTKQFGASVGFIGIGKSSTFFELSNQVGFKWQIYHYLVKVEPNGKGEAVYALTKYLQRLPHQATIVYVTTQSNKKDTELFYEIASRGLSIDYFYVKQGGLSSYETALFSRMRSQGVVTHHIPSDQFNQEIKGGGSRASS